MKTGKRTAAAQRILVIDDEKDVAYSFQRVLADEPVEVVGVTSGAEGLKSLKKDGCDLGLLDEIGRAHD